MLKNLTNVLMNNLDEAAFNFSETVDKYGKTYIKDENEYLDELLNTNYTIIDLNKQTVNYLRSVFNDYKNL